MPTDANRALAATARFDSDYPHSPPESDSMTAKDGASSYNTSSIRDKLPHSLQKWRLPDDTVDDAEEIWEQVNEFFRASGYKLWPSVDLGIPLLKAPSDMDFKANGFSYSTIIQGFGLKQGQTGYLARFNYTNPLCWAARSRDGFAVIVRVLAIGQQGSKHLNILRKVAQGDLSLLSSNHVLPLSEELHLDDITFGVFPKVGYTLAHAYGFYAKNSVGDIIDMVMQALEGLAFLHGVGIAHRDAFKSNFLVEWFPESLATMTVSISRPRVYIIDLECAVEFSAESPPEERRCIGYPLDGSFEGCEQEDYNRSVPPEVASGKPYDPFKLDVWQLGSSLSGFQTTIAPIDEVLAAMVEPDASVRMTAVEALTRLSTAVYSFPPPALLISPEVAFI